MILTINGTDKTSLLLKESLYIRKAIGNATDVCDFSLLDTTGSFFVQNSDYIVITEGADTLFSGYVIAQTGSKLGAGASGPVSWQVTCKDVSLLLDMESVDKTFVETADSVILAYLIGLVPDFSISGDAVYKENDIDIEFKNESIRESLNKLAASLGMFWYIEPGGVLQWRDVTDPSFSTKSISSSFDDGTNFFYPLEGAKVTQDSSNIVNKVKVFGGISENSIKVEDTFTFVTGTSDYQLTNKNVHSIRFVTYTEGGLTATVWGSFVGYEGQDTEASYSIFCNQVEGRLDLLSVTPDNGTTVTVSYYYQTEIFYEAEDLASQARFGIFEKAVVDSTITNANLAQDKAQAILEEYANPRETIKLDILTHGFSPGEIVFVDIPELKITFSETGELLQEDTFELLQEDSNNLLLENYGKPILHQVQEVVIKWIGAQNQIVTSLIIGKTSLDIIKTLSGLQNFSSTPARFLPARLSNLSNDLGQVVAGLGVFTDGGTATFSWGNYANHTGVIVGVEETASADNSYGAMLVLDAGTEKVRLGRLNDLPLMGTVQPSGWGIYTQNGFFQGVVYASELIGGTITGQQITGGTITGALVSAGTVTGATIEGNEIVGGTIATSTPPINSSNPGVIMDSTGLYGYDNVGLVFRLSTDGAIKPFFSSGVIEETTYEISTSSVLRTGATNPRVQIDNSGIFAYDSGGVLRFTVDVATGQLTASKGTFSGTVSASAVNSSTMSAGTVTGSLVTAGTITGNQITGGTITGGVFTGGTTTAGTISGAFISAGTISGATMTTGTIEAAHFDSTNATGTISVSSAFRIRDNGGYETWFTGGAMLTEEFISPATAAAGLSLGDTVKAWQYLYLYSPDNTVYRLAVSNAGALVIT